MAKACFQCSFTNDFREEKAKVNQILSCLKNELPHLTDEMLFDLRIIYNELIINSIVHGNKQDARKKVHLLVAVDTSMIKSVVRDEGKGFDYKDYHANRKKTKETLSDHGRGLQMVLSLADVVKWNESGNEITFYKKISTL